MTIREEVAGPKGAVLHVNRQFISQNVKDGRRRPMYTLKLNGQNSKPIYAREVHWHGPATAVDASTQLACGARAYIPIQPGVPLILTDPMTFTEAKAA